ncbi:MAG: ferredoxin [Desulfobulbus propionicus]|nr:MAG: ferredoxin [Desulfobulbus propionicus]
MEAINIDTYFCSGCMTCVTMCPKVFILNEHTGKAELLHPDQQVTDAIREAAAYCPEKCILIED